MKLSCIIQVLLEITFVSVILGNIVVVPQNTTAISGIDVTLQCIVSTIGPTYEWLHGEDRLFGMEFDGQKVRDPNTEEDYKDFSVVASPAENFSLIISSVKVEYEGTYVCVRTGVGGSAHSAELKVEVPTKMVSLTCGTCEGEGNPSCPCRCSASGGYPRSLFLNWTVNNQLIDPQPATTPSPDGSGTFNFMSEMSVVISSNIAVLKCSVQGYENQEELDDMYGNQVMTERELSSPNCTVDVAPADTSAEVQLNCSCSGYPVATGFQYYVQNGTEKISVDSRYSIPNCGVDTYFLCSGSNGIGFEDSTSSAVKYSCEDIKGQGLETYAIILIVLACVGAAGGTGFAVYWFGFRTSDQESVKRINNDNTDGNGVNSKLQSESDQVECAAVNKPKSDPQPAPRSSKPPGNNTEPEKVELQYADIDHSNRGRSNEIRQPADEPTEYATVQSVIV